jgi:hypothetical protein
MAFSLPFDLAHNTVMKVVKQLGGSPSVVAATF